MKKIILFLVSLTIVFAISAQTPQAFKYQFVVRNSNGEILSNQSIGIRISIIDATPNGSIIYQEEHSSVSNQFGQLSLIIGGGTSTLGDFVLIDWSTNEKFIQTEIDQAGGTNFVNMGTSQLLAVPYALYSDRSKNAPWERMGNDIFYEFGNVGIGTSEPGYKLTVDAGHGLIRGSDGWSADGHHAGLFLGDNNHSISSVFGEGLRLKTFHTIDHDIRFGGNDGMDYMTLQMETGHLGIGTTTPESKLDVRGFSPEEGAFVQFGNANLTHKIAFFSGHDNDPNPFLLWKNGDPLLFCTDQFGWSEKMRIATNGFVGIGTESPEAPLHISKPLAGFFGQLCLSHPSDDDVAVTFYAGTTYKSFIGYINGYAQWATDEGSNMIIGSVNSGNIGVKTNDPDVSLHVDGGNDISLGWGGYFLVGDVNGLNIGMDNNEIMARDNGNISYLNLNREGGNVIINELDGRVGIGTNNPTHKLSVNGTIRSKEVVVNTGWSDFVFDEDYDLMSLEKLENYLKEHKHLPDIPSEQEVEENGVSLGSMDSKLLQKIEELTLYMIEVNRKVELLQKENKELKTEIKSLTIVK